MKRLEKKLGILALLLVFALGMMGSALAQPVGTGTLSPTSSERGTTTGAGQLSAQGGNVTNIDITANSITQKWAGYFGNITGSITLEDASGNQFYNWSDASPTGQVYATRNSGTPAWGSIACATLTDVQTEATALSIGSGMDNITNTFCETCGNHSAFSVGATSFIADACTYRTNAFDGSGTQNSNWDNVILHDGSFPVYTTIINQDTQGFDSLNYDFQLLVAENSDNNTLTTYYFYVEI